MSVEIRDTDGGLGNIITGRGIIEEGEAIDVFIGHLTQDEEKFKKYKYSLSDYTATINIDFSNKSLELIAKHCNMASKVNSDAIVAYVTNKEPIFALIKIYEILSSETTWERMVFTNREDAEVWIRERVKEKFGIGNLTFN